MKTDEKMLEALYLNPACRCPCIVCADCSSSMSGKPIAALNKGLKRYLASIRADDGTALSVETALVKFATKARVAHGFATIDEYPETLPELTAEGLTATGPALELAERLLAERQAQYRRAGISSYTPWILLLTDGQPYPDTGWKEVVDRIKSRSAAGELRYLAIGVGDKIKEKALAALSPEEPGVVYLDGFRFEALFDWLSMSLRNVSMDIADRNGGVPLCGMNTWARFATKGGAR